MSVVANVAINVDSSGAVSKLRQVQTQATATERAFGGISSAAGKLQTALAGIGIAGLVLQTSRAAASFNDLKTRLKLLSDQYGEFNKAQQFAAQSATKFGQSNREALAGFTDIYARLKPLGVSLKDIQTTYTGFNTVAKLSGVSAEGASAAFTQLAQALGSGALQGDEFRSIAEQVPGLLAAVSLETGIATKDLKKFASDGKLTSDIIINALRRIETEGAGKLSALVQSSDVQKFKDFQNAVDELSITVGNQLLPVLTPLIKQTTDLISGIAALPQPVLTATGELVKLVVQLLLVQKAIQGIIALRAGFTAAMLGMTAATVASSNATIASAGAFALYTNNAKTLQATTAGVVPVLDKLKLAMRAIPGAGWTAAAIIGLALLGKAVYDTNETFRNFVDNIGGVVASDFKSSVEGMTEDAQTSTNAIQVAFEDLSKKLKGNTDFVSTLFNQLFGTVSDQGASSAGNMGNSFANAFNSMAKAAAGTFGYISQLFNSLPAPLRAYLGQGNSLTAAIGAVQYGAGAAQKAAAPNAQKTGMYGKYIPGSAQVEILKTPKPATIPTVPTGGKTGKDGAKGADDAARQLKAAQDLNFEQQNSLRLLQAGNEYAKIFTQSSIKRLEIERKYNELIAASKGAAETKLLQEAKSNELQQVNLTQRQELDALLKQAQAPLNDAVAAIKDQAAYEREYGELIKNGTNPELAKQLLEIKKAYNESVKLLEPAVAAAQAAVTKAEAEGASAEQIKKYREELERIEAIRKGLKGKKDEGDQAAKDAAALKEAQDKASKAPGAIIGKRIEELKKELAELTNLGNIAVKVADGIGNAFSNSFKGIISGSMTAKEALAGFFQSVADQFLDMAAQIIATWIRMTILNSILRLFPEGAVNPEVNAIGKGSPIFVAANGATFSNGITKFARGGIVNSPTMFQFAKGGSMATGIMGEAGPEAIMPLSRGPGGKLGVMSSGGGGTSVVVNVDASGSKVEGNEQEGKQLGKVLAAAVQAELIKQKRPGGLLA